MKASEVYEYLKENIENMLENIGKSNIRNEYKVCILTRYALPSLRYMLTVHDINATQLKSLDVILDRYLKLWLGVPHRGANLAVVHDPDGLNIPTITDLYRTCHCLAYSRSRIKGDDIVNHALDRRLERESGWSRQMSFTVDAHETHLKVPDSLNWNQTKTRIKKLGQDDCREKWIKLIEPLLVQGEFMKVVHMENTDVTWKSIIYNVPQGVMKFIVNAAIDSLPTNKNLYRWGKRISDKCNLCNCTGTLHHVLNNCEKMLDRYTWRHNNIIHIILKNIKPTSDNTNKVYADIEGENINGGTIPPHIIPTQQKPDICHIDNNNKTITIIELTIPFETNIDNAHQRKQDRYAGLTHDITATGWKSNLLCIEVGSRGLITPHNKCRLKEVLKLSSHSNRYPDFRDQVVKTVLFNSYVIFQGRCEPTWQIDQYMKV